MSKRSRMRLGAQVWLTVLVVLAAAMAPVTALADSSERNPGTVTHQQFDVSGTGTNPCNGEAFTYQSQVVLVTQSSTDPAGGFSISQLFVMTGTGQGLVTNVTYRIADVVFSSLSMHSGVTQDLSVVSTNLIAAGGKAPSFRMHVFTLLRVDAKGNVITSIDHVSFSCT